MFSDIYYIMNCGNAGHEEIVSIFPDPLLQLHTTRSWDFLNMESGTSSKLSFHHNMSSDVIIGVIDTGACLLSI